MDTISKESGLGDNFMIDEFDLSGDVSSVDEASGGPELWLIPGINALAMERTGLHRDGTISFTTFFNTATGQEHDALSGLPTTDRVATYLRGTTLGNPAACMVTKQVNYAFERGDDGSLTATVQAQANDYGLQWGVQHTAGRRVDTGATNGSSVDAGDVSTFGLQAFLHVVAFSGTDATVTIEESSDDGVGDSWQAVTGGAFTQVTGVGAERIVTSGSQTVERYLRVATTTSGGFSSLDFVVVVVRNLTSTTF